MYFFGCFFFVFEHWGYALKPQNCAQKDAPKKHDQYHKYGFHMSTPKMPFILGSNTPAPHDEDRRRQNR